MDAFNNLGNVSFSRDTGLIILSQNDAKTIFNECSSIGQSLRELPSIRESFKESVESYKNNLNDHLATISKRLSFSDDDVISKLWDEIRLNPGN
jgi:hypothetical protein